MTFYTSIRSALHKRALYNRTRRELQSLPTSLAVEDLGIYPGDAHSIARQAVYGR